MTMSTIIRLLWCCSQLPQSVTIEVSEDPISHPLNLGLPEDTGGFQDQQQDEQAKGEYVLPFRADKGNLGPKGLQQAKYQPSQHGTGNGADTADHRRGKGLEADNKPHGKMERTVIDPGHNSGSRSQGRADKKGQANDPVDINPHQFTGILINGNGPHGLAIEGPVNKKRQGHHQQAGGNHQGQLGVGDKHIAEIKAVKTKIGIKGQVFTVGYGHDPVGQDHRHGKGGDKDGQTRRVQHRPVGDPLDNHSQHPHGKHTEHHGADNSPPALTQQAADGRQDQETDKTTHHVEITVGKVKQFDNTVHHGVTKGHQRIKRAQNQAIGQLLHNLFELAYAATLAEKNQVEDFFYFEMLEGMADHVRRALQELAGDVLLYAPVATRAEFINAIAYLIRRLDENTAKENFLRYAPGLEVDSREWNFLEERFVASCHFIDQTGTGPNRSQDRNTEIFAREVSTLYRNSFSNEADTDWSLPANRQWAEKIRSRWMKSAADTPLRIPVVVAGEEFFADREFQESMDPSQHPEQICVARFALATGQDIDTAVRTARRDPDGWRRKTSEQRHQILARVAMELREKRGEFLGTAAADTGKVFTEADIEVSEAIDFAEFYPLTARRFDALPSCTATGKGVGLVISPWNFPVAIPCGGLVAALAAGNTVIFKPSSDAVLVAWQLCQCFWKGGISKNTLQFLPCSGGRLGPRLTGHAGIDFIILTGGTATGLAILHQTPDVYLAAETGGKNATIVTDMADRDQAIKNVVYSAFGNSGQKCSATSLLILEKTVYDDPHFRQQLVDAARSMHVGSAWDFANRLGTLIKPPAGELQYGLTELDNGEEWALQPMPVADNPQLWSPGIKYGVRPHSRSHLTEFFGPILGVMRADDLDHAIELVNQTGYGLTSGLESLDRREQEKWQARISAGNLYLNRGTTGAITLRQPFGGMGKSALGPGIKAGGPDYVSQFMDFMEHGYPQTGVIEQETDLLRLAGEWEVMLRWDAFGQQSEDIGKTIAAIRSYLYQVEQKFGRRQDYFHLRGQENILRYLPINTMVIRLHPDDSLFETLARIAAARAAGCRPVVSIPTGLANEVTAFLEGRYGQALLHTVPLIQQDDKQLVDSLLDIERIRYAAQDRVPAAVFQAAAEIGFYIAGSPVYMEGRLELLQYFRQQSICNNYHRYGNLGERGELDP